jgi:hypothetical protein
MPYVRLDGVIFFRFVTMVTNRIIALEIYFRAPGTHQQASPLSVVQEPKLRKKPKAYQPDYEPRESFAGREALSKPASLHLQALVRELF